MTKKRYKVHNIIKGMNVGESVDLELMKELIEEYGTYEYVDVAITNNGKEMTYKETVDLLNENEQLKNEVYDWKASAKDYLKLGQSLKKENEQLKVENEKLKKENEKLHQKIFEIRTENALDRIEINKQHYTVDEFKEMLDKW